MPSIDPVSQAFNSAAQEYAPGKESLLYLESRRPQFDQSIQFLETPQEKRMSHNEFRLHLDTIVHTGSALGRFEGKVIFVPYALPGETVTARVEKSTKNWSLARLLKVEKPSPHRRKPVCPHFGVDKCGGCQWQHIRYKAQLGYKYTILQDQFARIAKMKRPPVRPTVPGGPPLHYRNHIRLHAAPPDWGYIDAGNKRVIAIRTCPLMHPLLTPLFSRLPEAGHPNTEVSLRAGTRTGGTLSTLQSENVSILEKAGGFTFRISAGSFFQVNSTGAETLINLVLRYAHPQPEEFWLDLYAGTGLFTLPLAEQAGHVTAVESHPEAVQDARFNAEAAGLTNISFIQERTAPGLKQLTGKYSAAVLDPPRTGVSPAVFKELIRLHISRLIYVSCDPATLARDAAVLTKYGFSLAEIQPVDLFPQTFHIESVCLFER
jgi:23S rRNA (uracil1939-C5)-methyltransferase